MLKLNWDDLLIQDISPDQFRDWISPWSQIVTGRIAPAFMSKFGCWFLRRPEGHVEILDVFTGELVRLSETYDDFVRDVNRQGWQETFLFSELVFQLHQEGKIPGAGQCYTIAPHPAIGGPNPWGDEPIDPRFIMVGDILVWQSICAQLLGVGS